jgi:hypothetical protein
MNEVGCYVAFPGVRDAILIATGLLLAMIFLLARFMRERREWTQVTSPIPIRRKASMTENIAARPTAPFTVFYRTATGEGVFICRSCAVHRSDIFPRAADAFAVAAQHLNLCRAGLRHRPVEGSAIIDGVTHAAVLREGIMCSATIRAAG